MLRRCTAPLALLSVALIGAMGPSRASAASIVSEMKVNGVETIVPNGTPGSTKYAYYELVNISPTAVNENNLIGMSIVPPNSVQPPDPLTAPLTALVKSSFGFDPSSLQVLLGALDPSTQGSSQGLALLFGNGGFTSGGVLNFKVSLDPSYSSTVAPTLALLPPDPSSGFPPTSLLLLPYTPSVADGAPSGAASTPEPVSLALWSALVGAGLLRARAFRRSRSAAPALIKG